MSNPTFTIFKKEAIEAVRDRRTMIVIPMLLFPVLITVAVKFTRYQVKKAQEKVLNVALISHGNAEEFRETLLAREDLKIHEEVPMDLVRGKIRSDSLDAAIEFEEGFDRKVQNLQQGRVDLYYKSAQGVNITRRRMTDMIDEFEKELISNRLKKLYLDENIANAVHVERNDISTQEERIGMRIGGFLPYIFVIFGFMGCMYPAIDLGAGEKERGTLETLLTSPVTRGQIVLGKFCVVTLAGMVSATITLLGMFAAVSSIEGIPEEIQNSLLKLFAPSVIILSFSLLLPLIAFFAATLLAFSIFAKSFKEAQSLMTPLNIVIIIPVLLGLLPGLTLTPATALIPILNVSLAIKEIFARTISPVLLVEVFASLILLAGASLYFCTKWFEREQTIFREV
jgi:sodium transport system permease protein